MTLFKQIALLIFICFVLLFSLISIDNFQKSGFFLRGQMQTTAADTATVLAIAISSTNSGDDVAALETLFNAVFDSGYYSDIRLVSIDGEIIHRKARALTLDEVPDWFISAVPLPSATGKANVMQGWNQLGEIQLTLHPGFAYAGLYKNLLSSFWWFLALFVLTLILIWYVLHVLLKPLKKVAEQAEAVQHNQFIKQKNLPKTRELRLVVDGMNRLVSKVQAVFNRQKLTLEEYRELLYLDELTGLNNRRFILGELNKILGESVIFQGDLILIKILHLQALEENQGYLVAEKQIKQLAEIIVKATQSQQSVNCSRFSHDEFALLLDNQSQENYAESLLQKIFADYQQSNSDKTSLVAAITHVHSGNQVTDVLSELDLAINQAQSKGAFEYQRVENTRLILPKGKIQWRDWLDDCLSKQQLYLVLQPVFDKQKKIIQQEIFVRLNDADNQVIPAGVFMPMAIALHQSSKIDKEVFRLVKDLSQRADRFFPLAVNISASFLQHAEAIQELTDLLQHFQTHNMDLFIEVNQLCFLQYPQSVLKLAQIVRQFNQQLAIDNLDINSDLNMLQKFSPAYIKINANTLKQMSDDKNIVAYQALRTLTQTLDIQIIAVGVEDENLCKKLFSLQVDGVQGNFLAKPEEIT